MAKILVIDDSLSDLKLTQKILRSRRHKVVELTAVNDIVSQVETIQPDVILLDIVMPGTNGYEMCRQLKRWPSTADIPVIFLSAKSQESDIYWGKAQGADAYLVKPYHPDRLLEVVEELVKLKRKAAFDS